ncbi:MAG: hypothetical protein ACK4RT_01005 [Erythrobacter sp.]
MAIRYEHVAEVKAATIKPGGVFDLLVEIPQKAKLIGGGGHCQDLPVGSAGNYVLKSSYPIFRSDGVSGWHCVWTNTSDVFPPQVVQFTVWAIYRISR